MNLRHKVLLLATVPLILVVSAITFLITHQAQSLSEEQIASFERAMLTVKKSELINHVSLAQSSIRHVYENAGPDDRVAQERAKEILNALTYGPDGYFFVYDFDGKNLVHPKQPHRVGNNWWTLKDPEGNLVIQHLILQAQQGGGFHRYLWEKPSIGEIADKIGYAVALDKWGWMLGTGLYIDDVIKQVQAVESEVSQGIRQTAIIILVIAFGCLAIIFMTGIAINLHEWRMADAKHKELTQRIVVAQEEERGRVARDLHDGISQILVAVKYTLELASTQIRKKEKGVAGSIGKAADGLDMAIKEVRRISRDLRPSALDDLGLSPTLNILASEFSERTGIKVDINTVAFKNLLPKDAKTTLFRVAQEALTNIERHAHADRVKIELSAPCGEATLAVSDNGMGFNVNGIDATRRPLAGIGLRNMRERVEHHSGELRILSSAKGTTIEARLPKSLLRCAPGVLA